MSSWKTAKKRPLLLGIRLDIVNLMDLKLAQDVDVVRRE